MEISNESYKYILTRVLERAFESIEEANENGDEFYKGRKLAYYEIADIIKSELYVRDAQLSEFGLDIDLEKKRFYDKRTYARSHFPDREVGGRNER